MKNSASVSRKFFAVVLAVLMAFGTMAVTAFAEDAKLEVTPNHEEKSITVKRFEGEGYMYSISPAEGKAGLSEDKKSNVYSELTPGTTYTITVSRNQKDSSGNDVYKVDEVSGVKSLVIEQVDTAQVTLKAVQDKPASINVETTSSSATFTEPVSTSSLTVEYSMDGKKWQEEKTFEKLNPGKCYDFYARYKESDDKLAGEPAHCCVPTLEKSDNKKASAPSVEKVSGSSVTLKAVDGCEYSIDGGQTWQDSNVFSDLKENEIYSFVQRYKVNEDEKEPNPASDKRDAKTNTGDVYIATIKTAPTVADGKKYSNKPFEVYATSDSRSEKEDPQWGDTKLVPSKVVGGSEMSFNTEKGLYVGTITTGAKNANTKVTVEYSKYEYHGEKDGWVLIDTVTQDVQNVDVAGEYSAATEVLNVFTNTLPNLVVKGINIMVKLFGFLVGLVQK